MPIKFKAKAKDETPADLQPSYVERDGAFVLDVEGAVDLARVDEVRDSNAALMCERDELKRRSERNESEQVRAIAAEPDALNALTSIQIGQGGDNGWRLRRVGTSAGLLGRLWDGSGTGENSKTLGKMRFGTVGRLKRGGYSPPPCSSSFILPASTSTR